MNKFNLSLGRWFGTPVTINWSWSVWLLLELFLSPKDVPFLLIIFAIVILHECGHMLAGKRFGIITKDITLYPFGGCANMSIPVEAKTEFFVALGGPLVNVLLYFLFYPFKDLGHVGEDIYYGNILMLWFNMLPVFPMDGGRVARALACWFLRGDKRLSTLIVGRMSQGFCLLGLVFAVYNGILMLGIISVFIAIAAEGEIRMVTDRKFKEWLESEQASSARDQAIRAEADRIMAEASRDYDPFA